MKDNKIPFSTKLCSRIFYHHQHRTIKLSNRQRKKEKNTHIDFFVFFSRRSSNKRTGSNQLRRQLTDESPNKQRTPPNSTGTSLSPHSSSFLTRDTNPIRITNASNTLRMSSPATSKQLDSVTLLLKQTVAPTQLLQVIAKEFSFSNVRGRLL